MSLLFILSVVSGSAAAADLMTSYDGPPISFDKAHLQFVAMQPMTMDGHQIDFLQGGDIDVVTVKNLTDQNLRVQITLEGDALSAGFMLVPNRTVIGPYGDLGSGGNNSVTIPANGWIPQIVMFDGGTGSDAESAVCVGHLTVSVLDDEGEVTFRGQAVLEGTVMHMQITPSDMPTSEE